MFIPRNTPSGSSSGYKTTRYRFKAVDYTTDPALVDRNKLSYLENGYIDDNGVVKVRTGTRKLMDMPLYDTVSSVWDTYTAMGTAISGLMYMKYIEIVDNVEVEKEAWLLMLDSWKLRDSELVGEEYVEHITTGTGQMLVKCSADFAGAVHAGGITGVDGIEMEYPDIITGYFRKPKYFVHENKMFILCGAYMVYDGTKMVGIASQDYNISYGDVWHIPITTVGATPAGAGTANEAVNKLTTKRKNSFVGNGSSTQYQLDATGIGSGAVSAVVDGVAKAETTDFTVNRTTGIVTFGTAPSDATGLADNVIITFYANNNTYSGDDIYKSISYTTIPYGNGIYYLFANGNKIWRSAINDPTYFPDDNYAVIGDASDLTGFGQIDEYVVAFKENGDIYLLSLIELNGEVELSVYKGAKTEAALSCFEEADNDTLFLTKQGAYALTSMNIASQTVTRNRSAFIDKLLKAEDISGAVSCLWQNYYIIAIDNHMYIFDLTEKNYTNRDNADFAYTAYYWTMPFNVSCMLVVDSTLYMGTSDGRIVRFNNDMTAVEQYNDLGERIPFMLATCADDDGNFMLTKTMPKNGTGLMVLPGTQGSLCVRLNTDAETDILSAEFDVFDLNYIDLNDFPLSSIDASRPIPLRHKQKKYSTLQFIIENMNKNESLSLLGIIKQYAVSNFVKK